VSTSWPAGATAPTPGVEGAEPGVGAVVKGAAVVGGGALPPVTALNVFGPCHAINPMKIGTSRNRTFFCFASFCLRRAA